MRRLKPSLKSLIVMIHLFIAFACANSAAAVESIKGRIKKIDSTYLLVTKNQIAYTLDFTNEVSEQQIKRLASGDFASVTASFSSISPSLLYVSSVDYVGLNFLTGGSWISDEGLCYEFATFTRMYVYSPMEDGSCVRSSDPMDFGKYTYFINPDVDAWNMLISSNNSEYVGHLTIITDVEIEIELFDARTDATLRTMLLRRE